MIKFYFFVLFSGILLSSEYKIDIEPDSIFIGTQASIMVSFPNNNDQKTYIFNDININSEKISLIDKVLFHNSATYKIQIWEEGDIKIPSIIIDILKNNKFIDRISINDIHLFSYSNINYSNDNIRNIKSMKEISLNGIYNYIYFVIFLASLICSLIIWYRYRFKNFLIDKEQFLHKNHYVDTLNKLESLPIPISQSKTDNYYLTLSKIFRVFLKNEFYIKATEMTTDDIHDFFKKNKFNNKFIDKWQILSIKSDFAKFSDNKINNEDFMNDKNEYISLVKLIKKHNLNID